MSWQKHFQVVNTDRRLKTALERSQQNVSVSNGSAGKYSSILPEVYAGHPLRIERYSQYDQMDMDSEVNTALDIIANFCTQKDANTGDLFEITFNEPPSDAEVEILKTCLHQWAKINEFKKRVWRAVRSTLKYGDQFFIRDPETLKWFWVEQTMVEKILVNEADGKEPEAYLIRNLNLNMTNLSATQSQTYGNNLQGAGTTSLNQLGISNTSMGRAAGPVGTGGIGGRYGSNDNMQNLTAIDAMHVIHLSLSEGLDANWPFGTSLLESVFKTYRQKELLEDAVIIYRIVRAPERRVFYVDTGQMPPHKAGAYLERIKNEIHQKRIPSKTGGGVSIGDSSYSAMCLDMATRVPLLDGRTLSISELAEEYKNGKKNWAYSCHPVTGDIAPGLITWAGITRKNAQVIKIHLDNDQIITCTPDHKIPVLGKGLTQAKDLTENDSLIAYNTKFTKSKFSSFYRINGYKNWKDFKKKIPEFNHRIKFIEFIDEPIDTGTLTIDGNELYHDYHTFAVEPGIFVGNSMVDDFFFASSSDGRGSKVDTLPGGECLALDTKIKLLDGRDLTLQEMIDEFNKGIQNWVYSANPETGEIVPGPVTWAGVTRKNAEVVKLTFDNGESVVVTPDHKFPVIEKGYIEAQHLEIGESMIPLYERKSSISSKNHSGYTQVFQNHKKEWQFTHRLVANYMKASNKHSEMVYQDKHKESDKKVIHHIDFNRWNNNPENLTFMHGHDHYKYHSDHVTELFKNMKETDPVRYTAMRKQQGSNIKKSLSVYFNLLSEADREVRAQISRDNFYKGTLKVKELYATDPAWTKARSDQASVTMKNLFINEPERKTARTQENILMWQNPAHYDKVFKNQKLVFDEILFKQLENFIDINGYDTNAVLQRANSNDEFMSHFKSINIDLNAPNRSSNELNEFTNRHLRMLLKQYGFDTWKEYRNSTRKDKNIKKKHVRTLNYDQDMVKTIVDLYKSGLTGWQELLTGINNNKEFMIKFKTMNKDNKKMFSHRKDKDAENVEFVYPYLRSMLTSIGYKDFRDFKEKNQYHNHRLVSIEWLPEKIDTGTITVDGLNILHSYHNFALSCGIVTKNSLGQIDDLRYWNNKLIRGLRVPSSYLPTGPDDGQQQYNDGRAGTAYIQEFQFARYCERLQNLISPVFDKEFKLFVKQRGFNIDSSTFELNFTTPQHFSDYSRVEKDAAMINVFSPLVELKYFSKRYLMKRYLGMTEEELTENELYWRQENPDAMENAGDDVAGGTANADAAGGGMPGIDSMGLDSGTESPDDMGASPDMGSPISGAENTPDAGGGAAPTSEPTPPTGAS